MWDALFIRFLQKTLKKGALAVTFASGERHIFGDTNATPIDVVLHDATLPREILRNPDLAVGEAYMQGRLTIEGDDLYGFLALAVSNMGRNSGRFDMSSPVRGMAQRLRKLARALSQHNPIGKAQRNVAHHYDLSDDMYDLFLDEDRQYSCAYYRSANDTLEQAQKQKKDHIAQKLCLKPGMRVLDIGCGWGGMALTLARDYGVHVVGVTLSREQHKFATARATAEGLEDQVEFRLMDYRTVTERFDRIVSVGMFEHVGVPHYDEYFSRIRDLLKPEGVALVHTIGRCAPPNVTSPWIAKYIFPGGYVPALSEIAPVIENANLIATDIEVWRVHYADTLRDWRARFEANLDKAAAIYDEQFCRMWRYYLIACEVTFRFDRQVVFQIQLSKEQTAAPVTRDYMYQS
ncbi:MAG: cyclopropane-fatty-acyl-phospholipid synthase family protein [Sulfitobacter sp.]